MKFSASFLAVAGVASLTNAQIIYDNGTFHCPVVNGTYCAGANIIIRCTNGIGQAGNCNDNLAGEPPIGVNYSPCFQCSATAGAAACSKNGIVYPGSGSGLGSNPFPANSTVVCNNVGAPFPNGTNPGGPIINATTLPSSGLPVLSNYSSTSAAAVTSTPSSVSGGAASTTAEAGPSGTRYAPSSASGGAAASQTANAATSVQIMGAGAAVGFSALFVALQMI